MSDIHSGLAAIHEEGHQMTLTLYLDHCGVVGNEMAVDLARKRAAGNQEAVRQNYDSTKVRIRCASREGKISNETIRRVYGIKGENLDRREEAKLSAKN